MSLIADLLSKVKKQEPNRDVPPVLKDAVIQSMMERRTRKRLTIALVFTIAFVAAGLGAVYLVDYMKESSLLIHKPVTAVPAVQPPPQTATPLPQSQSDLKASGAAVGDQKAAEPAVVAGHKKNGATHYRGKRNITKKYAKESKPEATAVSEEMRKKNAASSVERKEDEEDVKKIPRQDKDIYLYGARTYERQGNYRQALSYYKKVLTVDADNYVVINNISSMFIYLGSYKDAIRYAQKSLNLRKNYVSPLINMGISYDCLGKYAESESYFLRALTVEPSNSHALLNLGLLYEKHNAFERANAYYVKLSEGGDAQGYLGLARVAERQNRVSDAIYFYKMAISTDMTDPQMKNTASERLLQLTR